MKIFFTLLTITSIAFAQNAFSDKKIDMHGGKYNSLTGYKTSAFGSTNINSFLNKDKNATKKPQGTKNKEKNY